VSHVPAERCLNVLELLAEGARAMPLGEIAERLGEPKSGIHRLLNTLVQTGWAEQDSHTGFYSLTMRMTLLGQRFYTDTGLPDLCQPILDELASCVHEYVRLAVVDGGRLNWLAHAQGARSNLMYHPREMSGAVPLHATASGKAWLSTLPPGEAIAVAHQFGFGNSAQLGPQMVRNAEELLKEIESTQSRGYGTAINEAEPGVSAIAAPIILSKDSPAVGTVSIAGPSIRMTPERIIELGPIIKTYAMKIGEIWPLRPRSGVQRVSL
jgi:IclR family transcriptional regulator, acetate operon repressor